ncbi:MAG: acyl-[acyl-carrier-protein]--UDP-N-acetylglucosamine O-acyltransferase, partial [Planctomycetota bacterium]
MAEVHPTAVVEDGATLHASVVVGPLCHVGASATIGAGTRLRSHVVIAGRTTLGEGNDVWPFSVLGGDPQDLKYKGEDSELVIGDHNSIRESVSIHKGTANDQNVTRVGSNNLIMAYVHIGH